MNVTLVYPCIRNFGGFNSLGKNHEGCFILHGLPSIAACLEQRGHNVKLLDLRERLSWNDAEAWLRHDNADFYGIYMSTLDYYEARHVAQIIRKVRPKAKICVGGPHPSIDPEGLAKLGEFDFVFRGEGEITFPQMVENPDGFNQIVEGVHPDLNGLPYEKREIFNMKKVLATKHPVYPKPFINVISGRGCPFNCSFCKPGEDLIFGKFRMRSVEHLMGEIELMYDRYHFNTLLVDDDLFTAKPDYVMQWCDAYEKIGKPFAIQTRADLCYNHPEIFKRMKEVGLKWVRMGLESGNQRILNYMRKGTTVEQNYGAVEVCHKLGLQVIVNYMLGLPTETKEEILDTLRMIRVTHPEQRSAAFYTPIVGTDMWTDCERRGLLVSHDPSVFGTRSISDQPRLKGMDYHWIQVQMYGRFYHQRHAARKILNRQGMQPVKKAMDRILPKILR